MISRISHVLPRPLSESKTASLSTLQLERLIKTAVHVEQVWLLPRKDSFLIKERCDSDDVDNSIPHVRHLAFVSDHCLLSLGDEGKINLWKINDVFAPFAAEVFATHASSTWIPCSYHVNTAGSVLAIALKHVELVAARVLTISLDTGISSESGPPLLVTQGEFSIFPPQVIKAIDADLELVLLSNTASSFEVVNWRTKAQATIALLANDPGVWNGVTAMRICGPYVLVVRMHTVEAYPIPLHISSGVGERADILPQLTFGFPLTMTYRRVSLTKTTCIEDDESEIYGLSALANDLFHGIFLFYVKLTVRPLPSLSVSPVGVRPMAIASPQTIAAPLTEELSLSLQPPLVPFGFVQDTTTFVSVWALGDYGRRGIWVARSRNNTIRTVVAFTNPRDVSNTSGEALVWSNNPLQANVVSNGPRLINGKVVHDIPLRDDITVCAVSDTTGRIALGSWAGDRKSVV